MYGQQKSTQTKVVRYLVKLLNYANTKYMNKSNRYIVCILLLESELYDLPRMGLRICVYIKDAHIHIFIWQSSMF